MNKTKELSPYEIYLKTKVDIERNYTRSIDEIALKKHNGLDPIEAEKVLQELAQDRDERIKDAYECYLNSHPPETHT